MARVYFRGRRGFYLGLGLGGSGRWSGVGDAAVGRVW